ncbi:hypothetical protein GCM10011409_37600 [Lentibacillus populi]|uniref:Uncharacterized protein n=1 Tax=Lentibacillus populi TaxID=1827502 RepID=A0A9W5U0M2_9BACI|nr:hypothetical protein GCM10011409_37600 [Lentibacillus populi]
MNEWQNLKPHGKMFESNGKTLEHNLKSIVTERERVFLNKRDREPETLSRKEKGASS